MSAKSYRTEAEVWLKPLRTGKMNLHWHKVSYRNIPELKKQVLERARREWPSHRVFVDVTTMYTVTSGQIFLDNDTEPAAKFGLNPERLPVPVPAASLFGAEA